MNKFVHHVDIKLLNRLNEIDQIDLESNLDGNGYAIVEGLVDQKACSSISELYAMDAPFRSHIHMARHSFGKGEYKYFSYPLPETIQTLRAKLYSRLVPIANTWNRRMNIDTKFPSDHNSYLKQCHSAGQYQPTPLLLKYNAGDYNCLHQDVYGNLLFPIQVAVLLSKPDAGFSGGEFILTEQRPRMQSRAEVVPLRQGDAVIFAVRHRPVNGTRRDYKVNMRHGVSRLRFGSRYALGLIFHDAQ